MRRMYHDCRLVHADLSEYNVLYYRRTIYIIDVSQSVEHDHPNALAFLRSDCNNVTDYFTRRGAHALTTRQLFEFVTDASVEAGTEDDYLDAVLEANAAAPDTLTDAQQVDEAVFLNAHIPRTLDEIDDHVLDYNRVKGGSSDVFHTTVTGMTGGGAGGGAGGEGGGAGGEGDGHNPEYSYYSDYDDEDGGGSDGGESVMNDAEREAAEAPGGDLFDPSKLRGKVSKAELKRLRKEHKRLVKEANKTRRENKIPKHVKKRHAQIARRRRK